MKTKAVRVSECFTSIQGESTYAGLSCFFIRLSGCNLRCVYCDTKHAYQGGREIAIATLARRFAASPAAIAEITGGEPLAQSSFRPLAFALLKAGRGRPVLVETNGSLDISVIPEGVTAIMDVKCPESGEAGAMQLDNLNHLRPADEVKFVISSRGDFNWACRLVQRHRLADRCQAVLFSPVEGRLPASTLAGWVLKSGLAVRIQLQLHKVLGLK